MPIEDPEVLGRLLDRPVVDVEIESAPITGLVRVHALVLDNGARFPIPRGNRVSTAGDIAELRALLAGLPTSIASLARERFGSEPALARETEIHVLLTEWALDPSRAEDDD